MSEPPAQRDVHDLLGVELHVKIQSCIDHEYAAYRSRMPVSASLGMSEKEIREQWITDYFNFHRDKVMQDYCTSAKNTWASCRRQREANLAINAESPAQVR